MKKFFLLIITFLFFTEQSFAAWTTWVSLGGGIVGDPAACTIRGITYVVAKGTDNAMWYRRRTLSTGIWDDWRRVPGTKTFTGSPSVACRTQNGVDLFEVLAVGYDRLLWRNYLIAPPARFSGWSQIVLFGIPNRQLALGSGLSSPKTELTPMPTHFARARDNSIYYATCPGNTCYQDWTLISPQVFSDPAVVYQNFTRLDFAVQATTGTLMHRFYENGFWYPFRYIGSGTVSSAPDMVSRENGTLDLFVRGADRKLKQIRWINGIWGSPVNLDGPLGGTITSGPGAVTYASGVRIFVFARGTDGALWYRAWAP